MEQRYAAALNRNTPSGGTPVAPMPAVFYRVRNLTEAQEDQMSRFLKKDILAWDLAEATAIGSLDVLNKPFKVIEYWFYYTRDRGLVGHPQDIEFAFVFVPADPVLSCVARIVAGAGHTSWVPNSVLVLSYEGPPTTLVWTGSSSSASGSRAGRIRQPERIHRRSDPCRAA